VTVSAAQHGSCENIKKSREVCLEGMKKVNVRDTFDLHRIMCRCRRARFHDEAANGGADWNGSRMG